MREADVFSERKNFKAAVQNETLLSVNSRLEGRSSHIFFVAVFMCSSLFAQNAARIPAEVLHKIGYINSSPPPDFQSALLWGIAIADSREAGFEKAEVSVAWTQLSCIVDGKLVILNDDQGNVRGGLYRRVPWFGTDAHEPMPISYSSKTSVKRFTILPVGQRPDRVWHFWSASHRAKLPRGRRDGCTAKALVKISQGALLQIGMDYWRDTQLSYGSGGNNHEAGVSGWHFPSDQWQEVVFSDIPPAGIEISPAIQLERHLPLE